MKRFRSLPRLRLCLRLCFRWGALAAPVLLASCSQTQAPAAEPDGPDCELGDGDRFLPLRTGATWTIDKIDLVNNVSETRVQVVGSAEEMDGDKEGVIAHPVTTSKDTGTVVVWQEDTGSAVVRHAQEDRAGQTFRDDVYSPSKGRLDERAEHLMEGATWTESYTARSTDLSDEQTTTEEREEEWRVERYGEEVEVPAGTFCTIRVSRTRTTDGVRGAEKLYWFARGVGKVKERNATVREVLTDYSVPAP